ncbi:MAG: TonB-dependent receptor [Candidatus Marinimicrobia bacterium]|nr:TonB-dependent receptor [Candidatus Neomarinimicrobiota bacterium]
MKSKSLYLKYLLLFCLFFARMALANGTGKIAGLVKDKATGEPMVGVNVVVKGEGIGAATDANGYFSIINVTPGKHEVIFQFIGYATVNVQEVLVNAGRTTTQDVDMQVAALDLGESVTVTAQRPIVEKDKTNSSVHIQAEEIVSSPTEGIREIMELSPGINRNADGTISIRGGGGYEISYSINGTKTLNTNTSATANGGSGMSKSENSWKYDINPLAVAQMEVISGGFNAEYGNAQSGVVEVVTREGGEDFEGAFRVEYRPSGKYHYGDYLYSHDQLEWQRWGDIDAWVGNPSFLTDSAAINNYNLWVKNHTPEDEEITLYDYDSETGEYTPYTEINGKNIMGVYDYTEKPSKRYLFSFGGPLGRDGRKISFFLSGELKEKPTRLPTVEETQNLSNFTIVLAYKPASKHNFKFTNMYQYFESGMGSGSDDIRWAGLGGWDGAQKKYTLIYDALREETVSSQNLDYKFVISSQSFLQVTGIHQFEELFSLQRPVPGIDKDAQLVSQGKQDTRYLEDRGDWFMKYRDYYTWSSLYNQASLTHYWEGRVNYSNQINPTNLIKMGAEASLMDQDFNASSSLTVSSFIWRTGFSTNYRAKTRYFAAYAQDKIEFAGMVANLGLRLDGYNFGGEVPADQHQVFYPAENEGFTGGIGIPDWKESKTYWSVSPRVGISFPISDKSAFRVQYGHFRSMPMIAQALDNQTNHGWGIVGNPNLEPKLSINYEIGLQHNLWDSHQLDIVTYYNDLKNQINSIFVETTAGSIKYQDDLKGTYRTYTNNSHGSSQGVEISFANKLVSRWRYRVGYALSQTKYGYTGLRIEPRELTSELEQKYTYSASEYTSSENRTHRLNASLSYGMPEKSGPKVFDTYPLSNLTTSVIYRVSSGTAYFWSPDYVTEAQIENNRRYPMESSSNLQIEKKFKYRGMDWSLSLRIRNLFDNKILTPISNSAELDRWVLRSATYMDADSDPYRDYRIYNYFQTYKNIPREFYFAMGFSF